LKFSTHRIIGWSTGMNLQGGAHGSKRSQSLHFSNESSVALVSLAVAATARGQNHGRAHNGDGVVTDRRRIPATHFHVLVSPHIPASAVFPSCFSSRFHPLSNCFCHTLIRELIYPPTTFTVFWSLPYATPVYSFSLPSEHTTPPLFENPGITTN